METTNPILASLKEPFVAGTADNLVQVSRRVWKLDGGAIYFCLRGHAEISIDLKKYSVEPNIQLILLPGSIIRIDRIDPEFSLSFFGFSKELFYETVARLEPRFFRFLKENPCYVLTQETTETIKGLMRATEIIYADRENRFRNQIVKNHFQSFMLDTYDKCYRHFNRQLLEGGNRQTELFNKFITLVHEHCTTEREVIFYAEKLCISTNYLTSICRKISGKPAKQIIDQFTLLEIKVLLQSPDISIQEVADRLGFPDQSYLGRYFKKQEGISPKEYQNTYAAL